MRIQPVETGSNSPLSPAPRGRGAGGEEALPGASSISFAEPPNSPLSVRNERGGAGGGAPRGRSAISVDEPRSVGIPNLPQQFWGRWASGASPEGACLSRRFPAAYTNALCPVIARPTIRVFISLVPS
jgi:hypothetical protein